MKRIVLSLLVLVSATVAMAQTDFRHISFDEALKAAKTEGKLVFVDFYTTWCGPCKMMARDVFPQQKVGEYMNKKFVCVKFDAEKEELELVKRCKVNAYPTFIVFNTDGEEIARLLGSNTVDGFLADIETKTDPEKAPEKIKARYEAGDRSAEVVKTYAAQIYGEMRVTRNSADLKKQLDEVIDSYYSSLDEAQRVKAENLFIYANYVDDVMDDKMQFLYANRGKVAAESRAEADTILNKKYENQLYACLYFQPVYDASQIATFKKQFCDLGLNKGGKFDGCLAILDAYATGNMDSYVSAVEKNIGSTEGDVASTIMFGMANGLKDAGNETKLKAAKFLRSRLAELDGTTISYLGMTIGQLEGTIGH